RSHDVELSNAIFTEEVSMGWPAGERVCRRFWIYCRAVRDSCVFRLATARPGDRDRCFFGHHAHTDSGLAYAARARREAAARLVEILATPQAKERGSALLEAPSRPRSQQAVWAPRNHQADDVRVLAAETDRPVV